MVDMIRRDRPRQLSNACYACPTTTSNVDGRNSPKNDNKEQSSKYGNGKKRQPKNKIFLKLWSTSDISIEFNGTTKTSTPLDEFTLSTRTFEAAFADGSRVFFRRDCFHRLLTVSTGSSVVIDDAPYLQQNAVSSPVPPTVASSLSAAFTSCNGTGLAWLSPEARAIYAKALEFLAHCEKLEKALVQLAAQNRHLKLPFIIGRGHQQKQLQPQQNNSQSIGAISSYQSDQTVHPFHAFFCPYCSCYSATRFYVHAPNSKISSISLLDDQPSTVEPGAVIEVGSSKDFSSSGIASKSVTPPNLRNMRVELSDKKSSIIGGSSEDETRHQLCSCQKTAIAVSTDLTTVNRSVRSKVGNNRQKNKSHCKSAACTQCLDEAIGKIHISDKRESSLAMKNTKSINKSEVADPSLSRVTSKAKHRHHHHHGGAKRKNNRHTEVSWTSSLQQSSLVMRSAKKIGHDYTCTPVSRCRGDRNSSRKCVPVRLSATVNGCESSESQQQDVAIDGQIIEIVFDRESE